VQDSLEGKTDKAAQREITNEIGSEVDRERASYALAKGYWLDSPFLRAQKQYVSLCLLLASLQDAVLGIAELDRQNLNWSATISYFSLVHAGRLVSFVAFGSYPMQHSSLRGLFAGRTATLNWLGIHLGFDDGQHWSRPSVGSGDVEREVARLDELGVADAPSRWQRYGEVLESAAKLRNDSNYEALLIAHEFGHELHETFERQAHLMSRCAEFGLEFAIDVFNAERSSNRDNRQYAEPFEALIHSYTHAHLVPALTRKVSSVGAAAGLLDRAVSRIGTDGSAVGDYRREQALKRAHFQGKDQLMHKFIRKVDELEQFTQQ